MKNTPIVVVGVCKKVGCCVGASYIREELVFLLSSYHFVI